MGLNKWLSLLSNDFTSLDGDMSKTNVTDEIIYHNEDHSSGETDYAENYPAGFNARKN